MTSPSSGFPGRFPLKWVAPAPGPAGHWMAGRTPTPVFQLSKGPALWGQASQQPSLPLCQPIPEGHGSLVLI